MINQSEQAAIVLQRMVEQGALKPGTMVSERGLMELSGFGRTPVREAIQRLALSHMLLIHPNKGIEIAPMSVEDQLSGLEVRRSVEVLAVTLACQRATPEEITAIRQLADELVNPYALNDYIGTVRETHRLIIRASHNPYLTTHLTPLQGLSRRFWLLHLKDAQREIDSGKALHRAILNAIGERDQEAAKTASLALNDYLVRFALDVVAKRGLRPAVPPDNFIR